MEEKKKTGIQLKSAADVVKEAAMSTPLKTHAAKRADQLTRYAMLRAGDGMIQTLNDRIRREAREKVDRELREKEAVELAREANKLARASYLSAQGSRKIAIGGLAIGFWSLLVGVLALVAGVIALTR